VCNRRRFLLGTYHLLPDLPSRARVAARSLRQRYLAVRCARTAEVGRDTAGLEYVTMRLQRSKTEIDYSLHASLTGLFAGELSRATLLQRLGFRSGTCHFLSSGQCLAKYIPPDFDVPQFAQTFENAFAQLREAIQLLLACGFYVERELVGGRLPPLIDAMLARPRGDGHNAPKKEGMKTKRRRSVFDYKFTGVVGALNIFPCRPRCPACWRSDN
jgi:hypothetical protein